MVLNISKMLKEMFLAEQDYYILLFSTQMAELCNHLKQTECGVRLRFFLASYIEDVFSGLFPHMYCRLYGSSVNGFGTDHSDLDLSIVLDHKINESSESMDPPFLYRTKMKSCDERAFAKKTLDLFAEYLQIFVPCITNTTKILHARVPIVKFEQTDSEIGCDLSMGNDSGCLMSEILWNYSRFDERVRPLVFAVRRWAAVMNLTSGFSTKFSTGFTNFHLMSLIVFFLEYSKPPVIPSIGSMVNTALSSEARQIISVGPKTTISPKNTANMEDLLAEFFQFYARFDFRSRAINLESGETYPKPDHFPIYVANPLEKGHNITKNVGEDYLERFVACCRGALWLMTSDSGKGGRKDEEWGLLRILNPANYSAGQGREINLKVNSIFEEESVVEKEKISGDSQETNVENTGFVGL